MSDHTHSVGIFIYALVFIIMYIFVPLAGGIIVFAFLLCLSAKEEVKCLLWCFS